MKPRSRRARPRPRRAARSPAASRRRRRSAGPGPSDQINLTDADSRIMPVAGGGFEQCYNAQAVVAADSLLVVAGDVVQAANDKQQLEPMLGKLAALPADLGAPQTMLGDNGYFSAANVAACAAAGIEPLLALGRAPHHPSLDERFAAAPPRTGEPDAARSHGAPLGHARRQKALRPAQAHPRAGVRHHQSGYGLSPISAARARQGARRVEPGDDGLEHQADLRPQPGLSALPALRSNRGGGVQKSPRRHHEQSQQCSSGEIYDSIRGRIDGPICRSRHSGPASSRSNGHAGRGWTDAG